MGKEMIFLNNISITFAKNTPLEKKLFKSLSMTINEGDFVSIIGNNGAGKSSLLRLLSGTILPDTGKLLIDNEDITDKTVEERSVLIARVSQDPKIGTCANLTIAENMSLAYRRGKRRGLSFALSSDETTMFKERLSDLKMGLENRINEQAGSLSGGQRQALSLLMATLSPAKLLLLDEHTAALDPKIAEVIMKLTDKLYRQYNLTILMITHNIKHALSFGNRTIMLKDGAIIQDLTGEVRKNTDPVSIITSY